MLKYVSGWLLGDILEIAIGLYVMFFASSPSNWCALLGSWLVALGLVQLDRTLGGGRSIFDDLSEQALAIRETGVARVE